jgi:putative aldouronate transport system permease protein
VKKIKLSLPGDIIRGGKKKAALPQGREPVSKKLQSPLQRRLRRNMDLYLLILPVLVYFVLFEYYPMYGVQIAFKDFIATKGILGSPWVGWKHFVRFYESFYFWRLIKNTLGIGLYELVVGFPIPILLALMINEVRSRLFKRVVQTVT